ncbi:MAG: aminodeoxychorismate lyase, partial [Thiovulaceae bacterium]|nr:aminodeoxychorismate lyase [Sulfurimonadaceae bacterium]
MYNLLILTELKSIFLRCNPELKSKNVIESVNKMNIKKLTILKYSFEILLIISLSFIYYLSQPVESKKIVYIPNGSINKIISHLSVNNYDLSKLDSLLLRVIGSPQSGWIDVGVK